MAKKEGRIVATGVNPQGVPWKEITFVGEKQEKGTRNKQKNQNQDKIEDK